MATTKKIELRLPKLEFDMPITDSILELEKLRYSFLRGTTPPSIFFQIKNIFQMLESIGSSRIEGNNTTIADYVESTKIQKDTYRQSSNEGIKEIENIEAALSYIEDNITEITINRMFLSELHKLSLDNLRVDREGSANPGSYRKENVRINKSTHVPPDYNQVEQMMEELVGFINDDTAPKYELIKIAIVHHRFVWIHPFDNGNGRVVRLLTYAMLLKYIFSDSTRIINPTAIFCSDRNKYYSYLSMADAGTDEGYIAWSEYMLGGLKSEIQKIVNLVDYSYLKERIIQPALTDAISNAYITPLDKKILDIALLREEIKAQDIKHLFEGKNSSDISRHIRGLIDKKILRSTSPSSRKYTICFSNNYLLRSILKILDIEGFLPKNNL